MLAGQGHSRRRLDRRHRYGHVGPLVRAELKHRLAQLEPVAFVCQRLLLGEQPQDYTQRLVHHRALLGWVDAPTCKRRKPTPPGPTPISNRPRVRWSNRTILSATM